MKKITDIQLWEIDNAYDNLMKLLDERGMTLWDYHNHNFEVRDIMAEKWAKLNRYPFQYKVGDIVEYANCYDYVVHFVGEKNLVIKLPNMGNKMVFGHRSVGKHTVNLVTPVEKRDDE